MEQKLVEVEALQKLAEAVTPFLKLLKQKPGGKKQLQLFALDPVKMNEVQLTGHRFLVAESMRELGAISPNGKSRSEIFGNIKSMPGIPAPADTKNQSNMNQLLVSLRKTGVVVLLNPKEGKQKKKKA